MQLGVLEYLISINDSGVKAGIDKSERAIKASASRAEQGIKNFGNKISAWTVAKGQMIAGFVTTSVKTLASTTKNLVKTAVMSFSEFEQIEGGAKLVWGDTFSFIEKRSKEAYKNVQMSATEYMKQANYYAVGLKNALNGDTEAAAKLADNIITAQADIVAALGIDAERVQNAFTGIMRGNYTMLDNLGMGIAGTKSGMEDVIKRVNEWHKANKRQTQYSMKSLADQQQALVDYVEMQGLAGYAEMEGTKTLQGSISSAKAAWQDLLTAMGTGRDVKNATKRFSESIKKALGNLMPVAKEAIKNLFSSFKEVIPEITGLISELWDSLRQQFPEDSFIGKAMDAIKGLLTLLHDLSTDWDGTIEKMKSSDSPVLQRAGLALAAVGAVATWLYTLITDFPAAIQQLKDSDSPVLQLLGDALNAVKNVFEWCMKNQGTVVTAVEAMLAAFAVGKVLSFVTALSPVTLIFMGIAAAAALIIANWDDVQKFFEDLWTGVSVAFETMWGSVKEFWNDPLGAISEAWNKVIEWFAGIGKLIGLDQIFPVVADIIKWWDENIAPFLELAAEIIFQPFKAIQDWWDNTISPHLSFSAILNLFPKIKKGLEVNAGLNSEIGDEHSDADSQSGSKNYDFGNYEDWADYYTDRSEAKGNWRVPFDDYLVKLHRDEMVLTKSQARKYRGDDENDNNNTIEIGTAVASAVETAMSKVYVMLSGEKVGDLTTRRIKNNINASSYNKLRALGG